MLNATLAERMMHRISTPASWGFDSLTSHQNLNNGGFMQIACNHASTLNQYMHTLDKSARHEEMVEQLAQELLATECNPFALHNLAEPFCESEPKEMIPLQQALVNGSDSEIALELKKFLRSYQETAARHCAEQRVTTGLVDACEHCLDKGCPNCM